MAALSKHQYFSGPWGIHPDQGEIWRLNIGNSYLKLNCPQDALPHFERALEIAKELGMSQGIVEESQKWVNEAKGL